MQAGVGVKLLTPERFDAEPIHELDGLNLDRLDVECTRYEPAPELLTAAFDEQPVSETLVSHLLKRNCLVTGQPDWGSVQIAYSGPQADSPGRPAAVPRAFAPQRIPRGVWSASHGPVDALQARPTERLRALRRGGLTSTCAAPPAAAAGQRAHGVNEGPDRWSGQSRKRRNA